MKILVIIPARKGSKRLKKKNILKLGNKPLVQVTIEFAKKLKGISDIIVSTDDKAIVKIANKLNVKVPFLRPSSLSNDKTSSASVCVHAINFYEKKYKNIDAILLLQPTSPFRSVKSINSAIKDFEESKYKSIASVNKLNLNPMTVIKKKQSKNYYFFRKKEKLYEINGNFFLINKNLFLKKKKFFFPNTFLFNIKNFEETIDIDDINDLKIAKTFL